MDKASDIIFAFDLDGTIANYGQAVTPKVANHLNKLGHIHIISGGKYATIEQATKLIKAKTIHAMREFGRNKAIDCASLLKVSKKSFSGCDKMQVFRKELCLALRHTFNHEVYVGGRATIDVMTARNKGDIIRKLQSEGQKVVYFYDCKWSMNDHINNDVPAIKEAWKAIRTDHINITVDLNKCLKSLT